MTNIDMDPLRRMTMDGMRVIQSMRSVVGMYPHPVVLILYSGDGYAHEICDRLGVDMGDDGKVIIMDSSEFRETAKAIAPNHAVANALYCGMGDGEVRLVCVGYTKVISLDHDLRPILAQLN